MTGAELRRLQRKARRDAERAAASADALHAGILAASAEGKTERWIAAELGISYARVGQIKRKAKRAA